MVVRAGRWTGYSAQDDVGQHQGHEEPDSREVCFTIPELPAYIIIQAGRD
jgi:hypothetical protein